MQPNINKNEKFMLGNNHVITPIFVSIKLKCSTYVHGMFKYGTKYFLPSIAVETYVYYIPLVFCSSKYKH